MKISVALDGPAGSGKSTVAKLVSEKLNLMYINTGAMYRAITLIAMRKRISCDDRENLIKLIESLEMHFEDARIIVNREDISDEITMPVISKNVPVISAIPEVRKILVKLQKDIANKYSVIMDGRDIGTVVLKDAPYKFFLTAEPEERAKRRYNELIAKGINVDYNEILNDILKRDLEDSNRKISPLRKAEDAVLIDSSKLSIEEVVDKIITYIKEGKNYDGNTCG